MNKTNWAAAVNEKVEELQSYFGLFGMEVSPLISSTLRRTAEAAVQLHRHESLCNQLGIGDAEHAYLFSERDRADKKYNLRLSQLTKLLHRIGMRKKPDCFSIASYFGRYEIRGREYFHWRYLQAKSNIRRLPKSAIEINHEYFVPVDSPLLKRLVEGSKSDPYEMLRPSVWRRFFEEKPLVKEQFSDVIPVPADARNVKATRNRLDYLKRKQREQVRP